MARVASGLIFALLLASTALAAPGDDAAPSGRLEEVQREIADRARHQAALEAEAKALEAEIAALSNKMIPLAAGLQNQESSLDRLEMEIEILGDQEQAQQAALSARQTHLARTLGALQRLRLQPPSLLLLRPASATERAQSAALLVEVKPALEQEAARLRSEVEALHAVRTQLEDDRKARREQVAALSDSRAELEALRLERERRRAALADESAAEAARLKELAAEAQNLTELVERLVEERQRLALTPRPKLRPQPPAVASLPRSGRVFASVKGSLPPPVRGTLVGAFGDQTPEGRSKGVRIAARDKTPVVAPYDGEVVFADHFRSYGLLLIISHGEGYHSLLAGMQFIDVGVGQWVLAGEPVARMPGTPDRPVLYVELQKNGEPINPVPWLAAELGKGR